MTTQQPEALRLACLIDENAEAPLVVKAAAAELRRLHQSEREGWRYAGELEQERKLLLEQNTMLDKKLAEYEEIRDE